MSLSDRLSSPPVRKHYTVCGVAKVLLQIPEADREALASALADPDWEHTALSRTLQAEGYSLPAATIGRHRKSACSCP